MIIVKDMSLQISMVDGSPLARRDWLIRAIAAAIRWNAGCDEGLKYDKDDDNLYVLAQLLEELIEIDNEIEE